MSDFTEAEYEAAAGAALDAQIDEHLEQQRDGHLWIADVDRTVCTGCGVEYEDWKKWQ
jgi:hypothetical protein